MHDLLKVDSKSNPVYHRQSPPPGYIEGNMTDESVLVERASSENLLSEYCVLSHPDIGR